MSVPRLQECNEAGLGDAVVKCVQMEIDCFAIQWGGTWRASVISHTLQCLVSTQHQPPWKTSNRFRTELIHEIFMKVWLVLIGDKKMNYLIETNNTAPRWIVFKISARTSCFVMPLMSSEGRVSKIII